MQNFRIYLSLFSLSLFFSSCATVTHQKVTKNVQGYELKDLCDRYKILWQWDPAAEIFTLHFDSFDAKALVGSSLVLLGNEEIQLNAPLMMVQSAIIVPADFKEKVIDRFKGKLGPQEQYTLKRLKEVVIDAGHGGHDPGAQGRNQLIEKDIVLDIAERLKKIFEQHGVKVDMTRENDRYVSLKERTEMASLLMADLFVSIHANSSPLASVYGLEVFSLDDLNDQDQNEAQRKYNERLIFKNISIKAKDMKAQSIIADMLYTHKQGESTALAAYVAKRGAKLLYTKNRGAKKARFFVLRNTLIPAILIEVGFLTSLKEEKLFTTDAYKQKTANSLARSILEYMGD